MALFRGSNDVKSISVLKQAADIPNDGNFHNIVQCPKPTYVVAYCYAGTYFYVQVWDLDNDTATLSYDGSSGWELSFTASSRFKYENGYVQYKANNANWATQTRFIIAE